MGVLSLLPATKNLPLIMGNHFGVFIVPSQYSFAGLSAHSFLLVKNTSKCKEVRHKVISPPPVPGSRHHLCSPAGGETASLGSTSCLPLHHLLSCQGVSRETSFYGGIADNYLASVLRLPISLKQTSFLFSVGLFSFGARVTFLRICFL